MTKKIKSDGSCKRTFDRVKDDECHNCMYAVRKPEKGTVTPWQRLFGCQNMVRIKKGLVHAVRKLNLVLECISDEEWEPNLRTVTDISDAAAWCNDSAKLLGDLYHDGYMRPDVICVYRVNKPEEKDEVP